MIGTRYTQPEIRFRSPFGILTAELDAFGERDTGSLLRRSLLAARLTAVFNSRVEVEDGQADLLAVIERDCIFCFQAEGMPSNRLRSLSLENLKPRNRVVSPELRE
jgi:hypothetical protein